MHKRASDFDGMCCVCCIAYVYIRIYIHVSHSIVVVKVATNSSDVMKVMSPHCPVGCALPGIYNCTVYT